MTKSITYCKDCKVAVLCLGGNDHEIDEYEDENGGHYYSCGTCIQNGHAGALGSIVHWCTDIFGLFSGEQKFSDKEFKQAVLEAFNK